MLEDRYGLGLTTASPAARDLYVAGVDRLLAAQTGAEALFRQAIDEDPAFALAHCAIARVQQLANRAAEARASVATAAGLVASASERERGHVAIFECLLDGRSDQARALTGEHLSRYPRDAVALSPCVGVFGLYGFSGHGDREPALAALLDSLADAYGDDWWFLSAHAFALVENGAPGAGRERVARALELMPRSANGAHIFAHALYELAEDDTARAFLEDWLPGYDAHGPLHCHLWWHLALLHLFRGDEASLWRTFEAHAHPDRSASPPINVLTDGVSLLWRARLAGMRGGDTHWQVLRAFAQRHFPEPGIFVDVHYGICLAALGDEAALDDFLQALERAASEERLLAGPVVPAIVRAAAAFVAGDMRRVVDLLAHWYPQVVRIGGSRAQRDLVIGTLSAAQLALGDAPAARRVLADRGARAASFPVAGP